MVTFLLAFAVVAVWLLLALLVACYVSMARNGWK